MQDVKESPRRKLRNEKEFRKSNQYFSLPLERTPKSI